MRKRFPSITIERLSGRLMPLFTLAVILLIWMAVTGNEWLPSFMLPSPGAVFRAFVDQADLLFQHSIVTLTEALCGLGIGVALAFVMAALMDRFRLLYQAFYPLLIISQTIPTIAIAPLLVLWMGFGMAPKITLVVLTTFFPIVVGLLDGYRQVDGDYIRLMRTMGAGQWKIFRYVKFPAALGSFFAGLKISASYAIVGAVIAEWLGGFEGLGVYMTRVKKAYAFDKMFAVIVLICVISLLLMAAVALLQRLAMPWLRRAAKSGKQ